MHKESKPTVDKEDRNHIAIEMVVQAEVHTAQTTTRSATPRRSYIIHKCAWACVAKSLMQHQVGGGG